MPDWIWLVLIAVLLVLAVGIYVTARKRRTEGLRDTFGSEYDRVTREAGGTRRAEAELLERRKRHDSFDIRDLTDEQRKDYRLEWERVQSRFVDEPTEAVAAADELVQRVMADRGYPVEDFDRRAADLSVEHPEVVANYRAAHGISLASAHGEASTEHLRQATIHYRALFGELLGANDAPDQTSPEVVDLREEDRTARYR